MIKSKSTEPSPTLTINIPNNPVNPVIPQGPLEISQITARLNQIRPQIPQIDKLLLLHAKLPNSPSSTLDLVKKLTDCRNLLVGQVENASNSQEQQQQQQQQGKRLKNGFLMNLGQLNLLIEQVQRLFNSLVNKMKESAGVSGLGAAGNTGNSAGNTGNIAINGNIAITSNAAVTGNNLSSSITSLSNSSNGSLSKFKVKSSAPSSSTTNSSNSSYEKLLIQKLSLPPDSISTTAPPNDTFVYNSALLKSRKNHHMLRLTNLKHLKQRNLLLSKEIRNLRHQCKYKTRIQDDGLGIISLHVISLHCQYIFRIPQRYPFDELVYRIEPMDNNNTKFILLPKHLEPKTFPISVTNIIRNHETTFPEK